MEDPQPPTEHTKFVETSLQVELVSDRLLTVPNAITLSRILLIPVFLWLLVERYDLAAAVLLGLISATDFVDGKIARRFNQVSAIGKILDPVADRLLIAAAGIGIIWRGMMPLWLILAILLRELCVSALSVTFKARGVQLEVRYVGKWAAAFTYMAIPAFVVGAVAATGVLRGVLLAFGYATGVAAVGCGWASVPYYFLDGRRALARHRAEVGA